MVANLSYKLLDGFSYSKEPTSFRSQRCTSTPADTDASVGRGDLSPVSVNTPIKGEKPKHSMESETDASVGRGDLSPVSAKYLIKGEKPKHSRVFQVPPDSPKPEVFSFKKPDLPVTNLEIEQELQVLVMKDDPTPTELALSLIHI